MPSVQPFFNQGTTAVPIFNLNWLEQFNQSSGQLYYPYFDPQKKLFKGMQAMMLPDLRDNKNSTDSWSYNLLLMAYVIDIWMCTCGRTAFDTGVDPSLKRVSGPGTIMNSDTPTIGVV